MQPLLLSLALAVSEETTSWALSELIFPEKNRRSSASTATRNTDKLHQDRSLLSKWTPLAHKHVEEWQGPGSPHASRVPSSLLLESIPESEASSLDGEHVKENLHFSSTCFAKWPKVAEFLSWLRSGSLILFGTPPGRNGWPAAI
ncbi:hypothetical protein L195_g036805 [Trifolium pratense]|uniref:Uncharacterized protein n=1 Tax=Trifolium pratense TaxID=57577 RepID=A0A2K3LQI4_TRIPR|nr:hypothetical protein L195_g036805 [Trifolium pratense]